MFARFCSTNMKCPPPDSHIQHLVPNWWSGSCLLLNIHSFHSLLPQASVALTHACSSLLFLWPLSWIGQICPKEKFYLTPHLPGPWITSCLFPLPQPFMYMCKCVCPCRVGKDRQIGFSGIGYLRKKCKNCDFLDNIWLGQKVLTYFFLGPNDFSCSWLGPWHLLDYCKSCIRDFQFQIIYFTSNCSV